ncbi:non-specific serine/threonine protein kinase [Trifolium repens]|nr:non-specific serine/threonine protein kinase [Trifolium repens]
MGVETVPVPETTAAFPKFNLLEVLSFEKIGTKQHEETISPHSPPTFISLSTGTMPPKENLKVKKNSLKKSRMKKSRVILPHMVTHAAQQIPPKEKLKVKKNPLKKNHVILLHMVTQAAQQVAELGGTGTVKLKALQELFSGDGQSKEGCRGINKQMPLPPCICQRLTSSSTLMNLAQALAYHKMYVP